MAALECGFVHAFVDAGMLVSGYGNDRYADPCKSDGPITYRKGAGRMICTTYRFRCSNLLKSRPHDGIGHEWDFCG